MSVYVRIFAIVAILASLFAAPREAGATATHTYEVVIHAYCAGTTCDGKTQPDLVQHFEQELRMVNEVWRPTGVSFRLRDVVITQNASYAAIEYSPDVDDTATTVGGQIKAMRDAAAQDPNVITIVALPLLTTCWSAIPGGTAPYPSAFYGVFCSVTADWSVLSHELGHHFCLSHTFTFQDRDQSNFVGHDGDGLADTPPDPGLLEDDATVGGADLDGAGQLRNAHEWCEWDTFYDVDPGSPVDRYCTPNCKVRLDGLTQGTGENPNTALAISYYKHACIGPYVVNGVRTEAFDPEGINLISACIATIPERQNYTDICGAGLDSDSDGLCDNADSCPKAMDLGVDTDGDGIDDACDLCVTDPDPSNKDTDGDGIGDVCDTDIDNDGCLNVDDDDPNSNTRVEGVFITPNCDVERKPRYVFAGSDSDGDGRRDCDLLETDDDGDGDPDSTDPCPTLPNAPATECQFIGQICPLLPMEETCVGGCGLDFSLRVSSIINPIDEMVFDNFSMVDDVLYVQRPDGMTASEVASVLNGTFFQSDSSFDGQLLFEIISDVDGNVVAALPAVQTSGVTTPTSLNGVAVAAGAFGRDGVWATEATWALSVRSTEFFVDTDSDGVPDVADNCVLEANSRQSDRDGDHRGNACDPDFDNDLTVTRDEADFVGDCVGVNLNPDRFYGEPSVPVIPQVAAPQDILRAAECAKADLDDDGEVTSIDAQLADTLVGLPPGPSGSIAYQPPVTGEDMGAAPDMGIATDVGTTPDTGPQPDLGTADQGTATSGLSGEDTEGCSCRTSPARSGSMWGLMLLGGLFLWRRRR